MATTTHSKFALRGATLLIWALAGAVAVYRGLRLSAPSVAPAVAAPVAALAAVDSAAVARLLGAIPQVAALAPQATLASRFLLVGVLAGRSSGGGAALIAVDGKPAKPFRLGSEVDPGLVLQSIASRRVAMGAEMAGPAVLELDMLPLR